jgi:hypothetical protein
LLGHVDPAGQQPRAEVACSEDRIVGEHQKRAAMLLERLDELRTTWQGVFLMHQDAVHVAEPAGDGFALSHTVILA